MSIARKKEDAKTAIKRKHGCSGGCAKCTRIHHLIDKMYDANIPVGYWFLTMKKFSGFPKLKELYEEYVSDLGERYSDGKSICLSGNQGTGKTMTSVCILKQAIKSGYSSFYITASDMLNDLTNYRESGNLRITLKESDFLVIDELDSRFFVSDSVKELFSSIYESVFRYRASNLLPTIICTNETEGILKVFNGQSKQAIESLNNQYLEVYPIVGKDFRKKNER